MQFFLHSSVGQPIPVVIKDEQDRCLTLLIATKAEIDKDGTGIAFLGCDGSGTQLWYVCPVHSPKFSLIACKLFLCFVSLYILCRYMCNNQIISMVNDKCVDVPSNLPDEGLALQIYRCHGQQNQRWTVRVDGKVVSHRHVNRCWTRGPGGTLQQYHCSQTAKPQRFEFVNKDWDCSHPVELVKIVIAQGVCLSIESLFGRTGTTYFEYEEECARDRAHQLWSVTSTVHYFWF